MIVSSLPVAGESPKTIDFASKVIREGGFVIIPTDTTYAIAADATNEQAVRAVIGLKGRSASKAMSIIVSGYDEIERYADPNDRTRRIIRSLLPGPVTLLLPVNQDCTNLVCADKTVGIRIPKSEFCTALAKQTGVPLTATSANASGQPDTYILRDAIEQLGTLGTQIAFAVDGGELPLHRPSTIIDLCGDESGYDRPRIVREGALSIEELMKKIDEC
uniref:L-threonylcarbamoyladenylate synthase n=1 Tax=Candidatus Kentrum sp. LPFa TaxID=2126335 RepID=A0A450WN52_9GAMM|nr:MAG: translation factor SUA5 [Candidatus Kentron sp. LPFa]